MGYEKKNRLLEPVPPRKWRSFVAANGTTAETLWENVFPIVPPTQTTYSWVNHEQEELRDVSQDARIFRNGLSTGDPVYDRGHEFWTSKTSVWLSHPDFYLQTQDNFGRPYWFRGPLVPRINQANLVPTERNALGQFTTRYDPYPVLPLDLDRATLGTQAIKAVAPAAPQANVASSVGELLSAVPRIPGQMLLTKTAKNHARPQDLAGEGLNYVFGVAPTIADGKKLLRSLRDHSALLRQLARDDGRAVRRKYRFPATTDSKSTLHSVGNGPVMMAGTTEFKANEGRQALSKVVRTDRQVWFSGSFTYFLPSSETTLGKLELWERKANYLLGLELSAEALWQLLPWSWLVDWAGTIGDVLANATRFSDDGLVIRYGYLMVHTKEVHIWSTLPELTTHYGVQVPVSQIQFRRETKRRYRATPFGFATDWNGLSPLQWAILAAIGITRT